RAFHVTGVQTCALPICRASRPCTGCGRACTDPCKPQVSTDARPSCTPSCTPVALTPCADRRCTPFGPKRGPGARPAWCERLTVPEPSERPEQPERRGWKVCKDM